MSNGWASPGGESPQGSATPHQGNDEQPPPQYGERLPPPAYGERLPPPASGYHGPPPGYSQQQPAPGYGPPPGYPPPYQPVGQQYPPQGPPGYYPGPPPGQWLAPKPGVIPLRPLRISDMFEGTFATIRGNPGATLGLAAVVAVVMAIPSIATVLVVGNLVPTISESNGNSVRIGPQLAEYPSTIFTSLGAVLLTGMLTVVLSEAVLGRRITIGETWQRIKGRILPLIGLMLLLGLASFLAIAIVIGIVVVLLLTGQTVLAIILGVVLFIVLLLAVLYTFFRASLAPAALVLERLGPVEAIRRSFTLTNGSFWRVVGILLLTQLIAGVASSIITGTVGVVVGITSIPTSSTSTVGLSITAVIAIELAALVTSIFTAPFTAGMTGLLYLDQRIRKEALDVTLMAAAQQNRPGGRGVG
ncbi:hypothetical protein [Rudaeicoccus suwonensis]|uniref:DUF7847 domain-containing protein n=1 Tax=Rudaeicoccus suwonensis TaxID=657409 RepID=A0A561E8V8_9MICO|nr:hypothetical protein [Rudaeicoccus suwonensis]TWE12054.1 hypothetical protein BKA23_0850 [Rudaeicoccus suwonensis]